MKPILYAFALLMSFTVAAQNDNDRFEKHEHRQKKHERMQALSPEQLATLKTKKLTLALDLSDAQQRRVLALNTKEATIRKAKMEARKAQKEKGEKPTEEERYQRMNEQLDAKIAYKREMKTILSTEQYERWEKIKARHHKGKKKHKRKHHADKS